jgi:hypothetical protein
MPTPVASFGPERSPRNPTDPSDVAEDAVREMLERSKTLGVDPAAVTAMVALEAVSMLSAYGRSPLEVTMAALAAAAPARVVVLADANARGVEPPSLSTARLQELAPGTCRLN